MSFRGVSPSRRTTLDARDDPHRPAAGRASLDVDADQIAWSDVVERLKDDVRHAVKAVNEIRLARYRDRPTGLAAFLGRVTGIEHIREVLHCRDDAKRLNAYGETLQTLKAQQAADEKALDIRLKLQTQEVSRKQAALEKIDRREIAAFMRDQRTTQRVRSREGGDAMPSLAELVDHSHPVETPPPDLLVSFENARQQQPEEVPDLMSAFKRAAKPHSERERGSRSGGLDLKSSRT